MYKFTFSEANCIENYASKRYNFSIVPVSETPEKMHSLKEEKT